MDKEHVKGAANKVSGATKEAAGKLTGDKKLEALNNTPGHDISLPEHLMSQARMIGLDPELLRVVEHVVFSLDGDGRLAETAEQIAQALAVTIPLAPLRKEDAPNKELEEAWEYYHTPRAQYPNRAGLCDGPQPEPDHHL